MSQICIHVPPFEAQQTVDLEVTINGRRHVMNYRVETFAWPEGLTADARIEQLRAWIRDYDAGWELVQIGPAGGGLVPVTFRKTEPAMPAQPSPPSPETPDADV